MTELSRTPKSPSRWAQWRDRDHTKGSLLVSLLVLSLPLVTTSLSGVAFQLVDLAMISRLGEDATTAIIVSNQSIRQVILMLVMGASFGAQGLIGRSVGEGRIDAAEHVAGQIVTLGAVFAIVIAAVGIPFSGAMLSQLNVSPEVLAHGVPYIRLILLLNFGFVFLILFGAILSGAGDSATPLGIALLQTVVSLAAEWVLIFGEFGAPKLGVRGVAIGLAIGQLVAGLLAFRVLFRGKSRVHLKARHLLPDLAMQKRIFSLAWPPALQMLSGFLVTVFFIRLMGDFGETAQAAYSIGLRLGMVGPMIAFPIAGAAATLVSQSLGSGDIPRAWRAFRVGLAVHAPVLWTISLAGFVFRRAIIGAFTEDPAVIDLGSELLAYQAASYVFLGFNFVFFRVLQGAGDVMTPMLLSFANAALITLPLGFWLAEGQSLGPAGVFIASLVSSITGTALMGVWLWSGRWTRGRRP